MVARSTPAGSTIASQTMSSTLARNASHPSVYASMNEWSVTPREHHDMPSDPDVRRLALEALLATERHIPVGTLEPTIRISRLRSGAAAGV